MKLSRYFSRHNESHIFDIKTDVSGNNLNIDISSPLLEYAINSGSIFFREVTHFTVVSCLMFLVTLIIN